MKNRVKAIGWAFSLAWRLNKKMLLIWFGLIGVVSVLPAVALYYNKQIIETINVFVETGIGKYEDIFVTIVIFGILTALIGLSNRLNNDLIYMVMFDSYYFGMEEVLMDAVQGFSMEELLNKDVNDEYYAVVLREGSLTDFISGVCELFGKLINILSLFIVAWSLSKMVFFISILYIIGVILLNMKFVEKLRYSWKKISDNERLAGYYENMPYSTESAKEMRIFASKTKLLKRWEENYKAIYEHEIKYRFAVEIRTFVSGLGFYVFLAAMVIYSIFAVAKGNMRTDVLLVIFILCLNIYSAVSGVARNLMGTDYGLYALERQYNIFSHRIADKKNELDARFIKKNNIAFETKDLCYSYKERNVLNNINLKIKEGETVALVGLNGSGKSTLIKLLLQLYKPESGNLYFYGNTYKDIEKGFLRGKIGAFFQDYYLFHTPIKENVGYGDIDNIDNENKIESALKKGGAKEICDNLPHGMDTYVYRWIEKEGTDFSGGERQKLGVSRAHMSDKEILVFDEPASMLDPISELEQFMNIKEKIEGRTAILISHRVGFARLADRVILLDNGEIIEDGAHDELMKLNGKYAQFFNEQAMWYQKKKTGFEVCVNEK